jgi:tetratricopeptide (TPR) repeat protein
MAKRAQPRSPQSPVKAGRRSASVNTTEVPPPTGALLASVRPGAEAISVFERAMKALQRHEYQSAADGFRGLLATYPREGALCERSMVYLALCEREMARRPTEPRTLEERLTAATAALNNGDEDRAASLARSVLSDEPDQDLAVYLLAAIEARRGSNDEALHLLSRAMQLNPEIRAQARHDADFEELRELDAFRDLIESPVGTPQVDARRQRRSR